MVLRMLRMVLRMLRMVLRIIRRIIRIWITIIPQRTNKTLQPWKLNPLPIHPPTKKKKWKKNTFPSNANSSQRNSHSAPASSPSFSLAATIS